MTDEPILAAMALTLATKAAEGIAELGRSAFTALAQLVRRRFDGHPAATVALIEAETSPDDKERIRSLQTQLERAVAADPEFGAQLALLWSELVPHLNATSDGVVNYVTGSVEGNVVQARDIRGNIMFGNSGPTAS